MDSLKIQDAFEPYYAGRKRFAAENNQSAANGDDKLKWLRVAYKKRQQAKRAGKVTER
ncbi:hypothetical protein [Mesorhizobium sp. Root157]|uniref:hypothetical protein n=1 Tax=Mesorhizobium sp. Root157 TaxID=1736477 RepID=UPI000A736BF5|nr:hypothetical protein [Mesorhizobium sp. Root157]